MSRVSVPDVMLKMMPKMITGVELSAEVILFCPWKDSYRSEELAHKTDALETKFTAIYWHYPFQELFERSVLTDSNH